MERREERGKEEKGRAGKENEKSALCTTGALLKKQCSGAREMAISTYCSAEDMSSLPSTHREWLTSVCNSSSGKSDAPPCLCKFKRQYILGEYI